MAVQKLAVKISVTKRWYFGLVYALGLAACLLGVDTGKVARFVMLRGYKFKVIL